MIREQALRGKTQCQREVRLPTKLYFQKFSFLGNGKHETRGVAIHDMNSDGFNDIITVNIGAKNNIFFGDRNGSFGNPKSFGKSNDATMALAIGDLNNDGNLDIVAVNNGQKNQYYINDEEKYRAFQFGKASSVSYGVTLGDFTNNGFLDILISNSGSRNIIYFNQSK